jgi:hypothetical protein
MVDWRIGRRPYGLRASTMPVIDMGCPPRSCPAITKVKPDFPICARLRKSAAKRFFSKLRAIPAIPSFRFLFSSVFQSLPRVSAVKPDFLICARLRKSAAKRFFSKMPAITAIPFLPLPLSLRVASPSLRVSAVKPDFLICARLRKSAAKRFFSKCRRSRCSQVFNFHFLAIPAILAILSVGCKQTLTRAFQS